MEFIKKYVLRFYANQLYRRKYGHYKNGEYAPYEEGVWEALEEEFNTKDIDEIRRFLIEMRTKRGRNDVCFCGSGKKYKKCHLGREYNFKSSKRNNMKKEVEKVICPKCHYNQRATLNPAGETPLESDTCTLCNDSGYITKRYFVEFLFTHIDRTYWMPIFFEANNQQEVNRQSKRFEIGLKDKYTNVEDSTPILYDFQSESFLSNSLSKYVEKSLSSHSVSIWKLKIDNDPNLSLMQNVHQKLQN